MGMARLIQMLTLSDQRKVAGIHTSPDTTGMMHLEAFGDRVHEEAIREAVGFLLPPIYIENAITGS
jgi:hypothetical protein